MYHSKPNLYGLPNVKKFSIAKKSIVSSIDSPLCNIAKKHHTNTIKINSKIIKKKLESLLETQTHLLINVIGDLFQVFKSTYLQYNIEY